MTEPARVQLGLSLPNRAILFGLMNTDELVQSAVDAEDSGAFGSVWVGDNFLAKPRLEAISLLSFLAARTRRVSLGTVCLATFPMRHPVQLAIQWATLDRLSGGRTILAVCNGVPASAGDQYRREHANMGIASTERVGRLEEGIEILRRCWTGAPFDHDGRYYRFEELAVEPLPAQDRIPIVLAANPAPDADEATVERILRRVARLADGWQTALFSPSVFAERWERIRHYAAEYGRADQLTHASAHIMVNVSPDPATARSESLDFLDKYYGAGYVRPARIDTWLVTGSTDQVTDAIGRYIEAGCTTPIVRFTTPHQRDQIERFAAQVAPGLPSAVPPPGAETVW